ncbi:hypothetical protein [Pseudomonas sp. 22 E 5]|jgi:hypothetical protein|nr:hypothetical protein [Pseudomonas sp. 22 E 5]
MSDSASIISDVAIDEDAFADFIHSIGGVVSIGKRNRGVLNWDEATLYFSLLNSEKFMSFYDSKDILDWENFLGAPPKTMIEMQLGHSKGSIEMYLWLAYEFGRKWNCVVDDVNAVTLNYSEVCDRYTRLSMKQGDVSGMRQQWPAAPDEYFAFMQERGHGEIKEDDCALSLLTIQPTLCPAVDYFGDDGFYKDGPYESGAKGRTNLPVQ